MATSTLPTRRLKRSWSFPRPANSLVATIDDGGNVPVDVAVSGDALAVANQHSMTYFAAGATKPTRTLKDSDQSRGTGAAFDLKGNCYWSLVTKSSGAQVDEFKGCKGKRQRLKLGVGSPYGLAFDGSGNLWYTSYMSTANGVYKCNGVSSCTLVYNSFVDPQFVNFAGDFKSIWVSDTGNYQYGADLYQISLSNGKVLKKIGNGLSGINPPTGVTLGPRSAVGKPGPPPFYCQSGGWPLDGWFMKYRWSYGDLIGTNLRGGLLKSKASAAGEVARASLAESCGNPN